ncbi:Alpha/Beta hydrolase protein [Halteromyces radiatus]|uniref:Alpha/Beta hydrolase protein n=1 Tax=Halteromyces radiatus TaxID=101107 RepID=UPI00221EFC5E|nr:Alpha/Beta hydrolase protein [Halteromyces radiatus]KAI8097503.1 Alpha/Beta hydrolase protein [Halteromyces radiatus]
MNETELPEEEALQPDIVRAFFKEHAAEIPVADALRETKLVTVGSQQLNLVIVRPRGSENQVLPIILFLHGGGWFMGGIETHGILVHELANRTPAVVVHLEYSLSPEAKYPVALDETYATLSWIKENAASIGGDLNRLTVIGDSAGANLSTSLCALEKEKDQNILIKSQVLLYPLIGTDFTVPSYLEYENNSYLPLRVVKWVWDLYLPKDAETDRLAIPLLATKEQLQGLPPALIITAEKDVLRDDGEQYGKQLQEAGVQTITERYNGVRHGFLTDQQLSPKALAAIDQIIQFVTKAWTKDRSSHL